MATSSEQAGSKDKDKEKQQQQMELSAQQISYIKQIKQQEIEINQIFRQLQIKNQDITAPQQSSPASAHKPSPHDTQAQMPNYLNKYSSYSLPQIHQNYNSMPTPLKWTQLPMCRNLIYQKLLFCIPTSLLVTAFFIMHRSSLQGNQKIVWNFKQFGKYNAIIFGIFGIGVIAESLLTEPFCDISSHHYNQKLKNIDIVKMSQKQYGFDKKGAIANLGKK